MITILNGQKNIGSMLSFWIPAASKKGPATINAVDPVIENTKKTMAS
ncbi:hypothetical protein OAC78_07985 [Litorivicinus sp.]|nr:hypothetical protein [Litorivicinus sp.]